MITGLKIRTAEFQNANRSSLMTEFELNGAVDITGTIAIVRRDHESRSLPYDKLKKRLGKAAIVKPIGGQCPEVAEAVNENSSRAGIADRCRDLRGQRLSFNFGRRED